MRRVTRRGALRTASAVDFMTFGPTAMALGRRTAGTMNTSMADFYAVNKQYLQCLRKFFAQKMRALPECAGSCGVVNNLVFERTVVVPLIDYANPVFAEGALPSVVVSFV